MADRDLDLTDRGLVHTDVAQEIRNTRVAEQWVRYDSIVIGPGASDVDNGWYNTWAEFAAASKLVWFDKRSANVGDAYSNQTAERSDWAQDFFQTGIEWFAPLGLGERETQILDQVIMPELFTRELPNRMAFSVKLAQADEIAQFPGTHAPSGMGTTGIVASQSAATLFSPGQQGDPHTSNSWKWPEPVMLPAQGTIRVTARIDSPLKELLAELGSIGNATPVRQCPGFKQIPPCTVDTGFSEEPTFILYPNWYVIRVWFRGPRYLQLRGGRSAR